MKGTPLKPSPGLILPLGALLLTLAAPQLANAQDYDPAPPPPPPGPMAGPDAAPPAPYSAPVTLRRGFHHRRGLTLGLGFGAGGMESKDGPIECFDCSDSVAGSASFHIGFMLTPRLAAQYELWGTGQALDAQASVSVVQVLSMAALQYWVTPKLWIKGGIGTAHLAQTYEANDQREEIDNGVAGMAAIGIELISKPKFAMDLQLRGGTGTYEGIKDQIHQGALTLGFSWY